MVISSKALFHFTQDFETLTKILKDMSFWPRYCEEYGWKSRIAVPMTCFCDIPLSQIKNHINHYGCYGIGLSKEFAINKGVTPIFYVTKAFLKVLSLLTKNGNVSQKEKVRKIISRIKPYESWNIRNGERIKDYTYYDEREWRYVPNIPIDKLCIILNKKQNIENYHQITNNDDCRLIFSSENISYLFVKSTDERIRLIEFIDKHINLKTSKERDLLVSKILTEEQIVYDL